MNSSFCSLLFYHLTPHAHSALAHGVLQSLIVKLLLPHDYISEASELARHAKKRIYLLATVVADHPNTHELIAELEAAAERGVEVVVAGDVFTFGAVIDDFMPLHYRTPGSRQAQRMARALKKAGVKFQWLGNRRATFFNGRTHSKWCVIDDAVFCFGGVNIYQKGIDNVDYMFTLNDGRLADRLIEEQIRLQAAEKELKNYPSVAYEHGEETILIDGGVIGQSIIYRRACELAEEATEIVFVSQYCPTGKLSRIIKKNENATVYFNPPGLTGGLNRVAIRGSQLISRIKSSYTRKTFLHAKFIVFTFKDGSKKAITGSHNFAYTGVLLGTREIALETANPKIISQLETFVEEHVAVTGD